MNVIGTAGHVDHGKSTIIKNLTSIDPDRLKEEKEREMTIDLGFAWLNNTNTNEPVGIIDVPGHEDLVDNMLKGVFAIDLALLVVAATESIKQQTIEHLEILKLLNIPRIILIVTKKDLASEEMIAGTLSDTKNLLKDYEYDESKNIVVDSTNSEDINKLKNLIFAELNELTPPKISSNARMYTDRVFHKKGYGTIVTGTLLEGKLKTGQDVYLNGVTKSRIRGLQSYDQNLNTANAKTRLAINLTNIDKNSLSKGDHITSEFLPELNNSFDAIIKLSKSFKKSIKHNSTIQAFIGSRQINCRLILGNLKEINDQTSHYVHLRSEKKISCKVNDPVILRSSGETIAGGEILNTGSSLKLFKSPVYKEYLDALSKNDIQNAAEKLININKVITLGKLKIQLNQNIDEIKNNLLNLQKNKTIIIIKHNSNKDIQLIDVKWWLKKSNEMLKILQNFHSNFPLRDGINKKELIQKLFPGYETRIASNLFDILGQNSKFNHKSDLVSLNENNNSRSEHTEEISEIIKSISNNTNPLIQTGEIDKEVISYLINKSIIIRLANGIYVKQEWFNLSKEKILKHFEDNDKLEIQTAKSILNTSRKITVAFLEKLDSDNTTKRIENNRILMK